MATSTKSETIHFCGIRAALLVLHSLADVAEFLDRAVPQASLGGPVSERHAVEAATGCSPLPSTTQHKLHPVRWHMYKSNVRSAPFIACWDSMLGGYVCFTMGTSQRLPHFVSALSKEIDMNNLVLASPVMHGHFCTEFGVKGSGISSRIRAHVVTFLCSLALSGWAVRV